MEQPPHVFLNVTAAIAAGALPEDIPHQIGESLLQFARDHHLEFSAQSRQVVMRSVRNGEKISFYPEVQPEGFFRLARATGCWLPGEVWFETDPTWGSICYASCWVRPDPAGSFVRVTDCVRYVDVVRRDWSDDLATPNAKDLWAVIPTDLMRPIAALRAAVKAMPDLAAQFDLPFRQTESMRHWEIKRLKAAAGEAGEKQSQG